MLSLDEINISYVMKYYKDTNIVDNYLNSIGLDKNQSAEMKKHITSEKVIEDSIKKWKTMIEKTKKGKAGGRKRKTKNHRKKRGKGKTRKIQRGGQGILTTLAIITGIIGVSAGTAFVLHVCSEMGSACLDRILPITPNDEDNYRLARRQERQQQRQERQQHNRRVQQRARQRLLDQRQQQQARRRQQEGYYDSDTETQESAAHARDR